MTQTGMAGYHHNSCERSKACPGAPSKDRQGNAHEKDIFFACLAPLRDEVTYRILDFLMFGFYNAD